MALTLPEKVPHSSTCICKILYPVIIISRILGIFPLSLQRNGDAPCFLSDKKYSFFYFHGALLLWVEIISTIMCFYFLGNYFGAFYAGTELVVSSLQIQCSYTLLTLLVGNAFFKREKIKSLYSELIRVHYKLLHHEYKLPGIALEYKIICERKYRKLQRRIIPLFIATIVIHGAVFSTYFVLHFGSTCRKAVPHPEAASPFCKSIPLFVMMTIFSFIRIMAPQSFAVLFSAFCYVIYMGFTYVTSCIKEIMISEEVDEKLILQNAALNANQSEQRLNDIANEFEFLRIVHQDFCDIMEKMSSVFGLPIMAALVMGVISVSTGIYSIQAGLIFDKAGHFHEYSGVELDIQKYYYDLWLVLIYLYTVQVLTILYFGQLVTNAGSSPVKYLTSSRFNSINLSMDNQIIHFIDKLGHSSPTIKALGMTTIGMSLVATLVTTVTTYILVMIQFKFSND